MLAHNTLLNRLGIESQSHTCEEEGDDGGEARKRRKSDAKNGENAKNSKNAKNAKNGGVGVGGGGAAAVEGEGERTYEKRGVHFRDEVGGDLAAVVGISDGVHVEISLSLGKGGKEGSSLVGKFDSLVHTTVIKKGDKIGGVNNLEFKKEGGVTDRFKEYLQSLKSPLKGDSNLLYGGLLELGVEGELGEWGRRRERGGEGKGREGKAYHH